MGRHIAPLGQRGPAIHGLTQHIEGDFLQVTQVDSVRQLVQADCQFDQVCCAFQFDAHVVQVVSVEPDSEGFDHVGVDVVEPESFLFGFDVGAVVQCAGKMRGFGGQDAFMDEQVFYLDQVWGQESVYRRADAVSP